MSDAPPTSRREQKKAEVREALVRAADVLFVDRGYDNTTVDQIAEQAGVSRRTFFRYFASKEAIAFPHASTRLAAFSAIVQSRLDAPGSALPAVFEAFLEIGRRLTEDPRPELRRQSVIRSTPTLVAAELERFRRWELAVVEATVPPDASPEHARTGHYLAAATIGIVRAVMREWIDSGGERDLVAIARAGFGLLQTGFDAPFQPLPRPVSAPNPT